MRRAHKLMHIQKDNRIIFSLRPITKVDTTYKKICKHLRAQPRPQLGTMITVKNKALLKQRLAVKQWYHCSIMTPHCEHTYCTYL